MAQINNGDVVRQFFEAVYGSGDVGLLDEIVAEDFTLADLGVNETYTVEELRETVYAINMEIPDLSVAVQDQFSADDGRVTTRLVFSAPAGSDSEGQEEPGTLVELNGISIARVVDGRIGEMTMLWESLRAETVLKPDLVSWKWPPWRKDAIIFGPGFEPQGDD